VGLSSVTLSSALTTVRNLLDEPDNASTNFWSDSQLTNYLNLAQNQIQNRAEAIQVIATPTVSSGQQNVTGPTDLFRIYRVEYVLQGTNQIYPLEFRGYNEMDAEWGIYQNFQAAYPYYYTLWQTPPQTLIRMYPIPASAGNLNVFYYRNTVDMVNPGDTMDVMPGWEMVAFDFAVYLAYRQDNDARWTNAFQAFEDGLAQMIDHTRHFTDQGNWASTGSIQSAASWLTGGYADVY